MNTEPPDWNAERSGLLQRRIAELGLSLDQTPFALLVERLYAELDAKGLRFRPGVYLSDQWGCPDGTPLIGVPFYLADPRLTRLEEDFALGVESEEEMMRYLRHEAGHAYNYAYRLYERDDWQATFGRFSSPYRERYHADPFSHDFVRHILAWYAQKHPDEDFAETFAVWLTPESDWRNAYAGWGALRKLEYVDRVMRELGDTVPDTPVPTEDDLPVEAMLYTVGEHYKDYDAALPISETRIFDGDLRSVFGAEGPESGGEFIRRHRRELVGRITHWTGEETAVVRRFVDFLAVRADELALRVGGTEASALIELTAFGTAVMMNYRYADLFAQRRKKARS